MDNPASAKNNLHHTIPNRDDEGWDIFDSCPHGLWPGEDDCKYPAAPAFLIAKWRSEREASDTE